MLADTPWTLVEPMPTLNGDVESILESVRSLKRAWSDVVSANSETFQEARRRSMRRHAIETGIIERLYDLDWGVTEALIAEGLTAEVVARVDDGAITEDTLSLIRSQYDALEYLALAAREGRDVTITLIKELHVILTRNQPTYSATAPTGMVFQATLHHGEWKTQANHVTRSDGSRLEYTPPEQVAPQMESLVDLYNSYEDCDPIVRAAWLHHGFVRIHPFEDGNGRVARCLTLLVLLKHDLAPLVVDRRERERYLRTLDQANDGDLRPLVRFFAELEIVALRSELERPVEARELVASSGGAVAVLEASIDRLRSLRAASTVEVGQKTNDLAGEIHGRVKAWLDGMATRFDQMLKSGIDPQAWASIQSASPPSAEARYWHRQVVAAARSVDFFANLQNGVWWTRLHLTALGQRLRYLVFVQKVGGGETGVLTLTVFAEIFGLPNEDEVQPEPEQVVVSAPTETVTWTFRDGAETNWGSVEEVLDATLAAAIARFTGTLG